jgi:hypothetical protein
MSLAERDIYCPFQISRRDPGRMMHYIVELALWILLNGNLPDYYMMLDILSKLHKIQ